MSKILYFDCTNGVSGDMFVGALIDLGADFEKINNDVISLGLDIELRAEKSASYGIAATKFTVIDKTTGHAADSVHHHHHHEHRHLSDIWEILEKSTLTSEVKNSALSVFGMIAHAEADVHGADVESVHFHEVGALDSIADIVAAASAFHQLGIDEACYSSINTGSGTVRCQHGVLPVPAPAVLKLLEGMNAYSDGTGAELATPTGTALIKHFAGSCGDMPQMTILAGGCGMGTRDIGRPNIFRAILGRR